MTALADGAAPFRAPVLVRDPLRIAVATGLGVSVVLHVQMAVAGAHGHVWSVLMGAMAALCLVCLPGLRRGGDVSGRMRMTMGMALAMALVHVLLLPLLGGGATHTHHAVSSAPIPSSTMAATDHGAAMLLVVVVELAVAASAVAWLRRRGPRPIDRPGRSR